MHRSVSMDADRPLLAPVAALVGADSDEARLYTGTLTADKVTATIAAYWDNSPSAERVEREGAAEVDLVGLERGGMRRVVAGDDDRVVVVAAVA